MAKNKAPYGIVKNSGAPSTISHGDRIVRFWKSKALGNVVEVKRAMRDVDRNQLRIVIFDPDLNQELNLPYQDELHPFQPPGATTPLIEKGLITLYEPYGNISTRA